MRNLKWFLVTVLDYMSYGAIKSKSQALKMEEYIMFRMDDMYGDYPTLEEIKRDYEELIEMVGDVTTIEQAREWNQKDKFTIEINGEFLEDYAKHGTNADIEWIRYESYGCLAYIYFRFDNGIIDNIWFDVWSNQYDSEFITDVTINTVSEVYETCLKTAREFKL